MAIIARGSDNIWESFQVARDGHIIKNGGEFIVEIVRNVLRSGVLRSEFRTKILGKKVYQIRLSYDIQIETDQTGNGEAVTNQIWDGGSPSNSLRWDYSNNNLFYRQYRDNQRPNKEDFQIGKLDKEKSKVIFILDGKEDNSGSVQIYFNGEKVVHYKGRTLWGRLDPDPYVKFGLYDDDNLPSGMPNRKLIISNIIIGDENTTLEELGLNNQSPVEEDPDIPEVPSKEVEQLKEEIVNLKGEIEDLQVELDKVIEENSNLKNKIETAKNILS